MAGESIRYGPEFKRQMVERVRAGHAQVYGRVRPRVGRGRSA